MEELQPSSSCSQTGFKRRRADVQDYKQRKLKKKVPADTKIVFFAEKEVKLKENMMKQMEEMVKDHMETMACLTNNLKSLTETMANTFALLQQSMHHSMHPGPLPYSPNSGPGSASSSGYSYNYLPYPQPSFPSHPPPASGYSPIARYVSPSPRSHREVSDNQVNASSDTQQDDYVLSQDMFDN